MPTGAKPKEPDPRTVYADIIDHPHWQSKTRPHMSLYDRAAQFSPFAALTGYNDMVNEKARTVDSETEPGRASSSASTGSFASSPYESKHPSHP